MRERSYPTRTVRQRDAALSLCRRGAMCIVAAAPSRKSVTQAKRLRRDDDRLSQTYRRGHRITRGDVIA